VSTHNLSRQIEPGDEIFQDFLVVRVVNHGPHEITVTISYWAEGQAPHELLVTWHGGFGLPTILRPHGGFIDLETPRVVRHRTTRPSTVRSEG
jgi:hypothetical protein